MRNALSAYYDAATAILAAGPDSRGFMNSTTESLKKTYIAMQSALGTEASLEIGARGAEYSLEMAKTYGGAISICALEASPRTHSYYSKIISYKKLGVSYINALVSERDEETTFYEYIFEGMEAAGGLSSILIRDIQQHGAVRRSRSSVKAIRGDTFIENRFPNASKIALWIDVEGAQSEVLHSLSASFARGVINAVYIEVEKKKLWLEQKMLDHDIIAFMNKHNFSQFLRDNEDTAQYNIIFVNNSMRDCDFSPFFDHYCMLLQQAQCC